MKTTFYSILLLVAIVATMLCVLNSFDLCAAILAVVDLCLFMKVEQCAKAEE